MRCSVYIATSVDGYIARRDGGLDWLSVVNRPGEDYGYAAFARTVDALVMGRATYDVVRGFGAWPYAGKRVVVLTHRPLAPAHGEEAFAGPLPDLVRRLADAGVQRVYVDGGVVIRQFLDADLVDDLTLSIIPLVLGDGIRLFERGRELPLVLDGVQAFDSGLIQLRYHRARGPVDRPRP